MATAMKLLDDDGQFLSCDKRLLLFEFEDGRVRQANIWKNSPRGLRVSVDRLGNSPVGLFEVRRGVRDVNPSSVDAARKNLEFGQVQVAVILPAGTLVRQAFIGKCFQPHRREFTGRRRKCNRVSVLFRTGSAGQN